ncbi:transcriptional regulator, GntR family [Coriobacterium glomerans PW2]|uniref:Transcriptional regulator, GntR family n=1 Tax=Coriobacterium glomerans (strain ATCC 49209 / DSM 20642 / JCM 10262 / PW2) TaxID=700015 RepID=F2NAW2_CORGP|nr:GntR family transcriptional regulator [Coriobacterium glomerans]AEB07640.1 transcriptional regulator, GntR family [Coriobacterium glomerans PW2]
MGIAKYRRIEEDLRKQILNGEFEYGDRFYSESDLIRRYNVSTITVIHALKNLVNAGFLVREQGRGTFVSRARKQQTVEFSDIEIFNDRGVREQVEIVSFECCNDSKICDILKLEQDETYHRIIRVRRIDRIAYMVQVSHIPSRYIKSDISPDYYHSIYQRFRDDFDIHLFDEASVETDEVLFPAPPKIAAALEYAEDAPCVLQHKTTILSDGQIAEYTLGYKRWDFFKIELKRSTSSTSSR